MPPFLRQARHGRYVPALLVVLVSQLVGLAGVSLHFQGIFLSPAEVTFSNVDSLRFAQ